MSPVLQTLDAHLPDPALATDKPACPRFCLEFLYFGIKEARACLIAGLFFISVFTVPRAGLFGIWKYPNQMGAWATVHIGRWSSWSLLVIMTFTLIANLKRIKTEIHVPPEPSPTARRDRRGIPTFRCRWREYVTTQLEIEQATVESGAAGANKNS